MKEENALGSEKISSLVMRIAIPSMLAQFVSVLYSIVDRMFVGNIPLNGDLCLAGVGVSGPIVTMISAFASLIGIGGTPLIGIALGEGNKDRARKILANCFVMLVGISVAVTIASLILRRPMLLLFGASEVTLPYAEAYFTIYVSGTIFALLSIGMYQFVIAQGFAKTGMCSVVLGAVLNIILDPIFIYVFDMGVRGAATATVISQAASTLFVLTFLLKKAEIRITFGGYSFKTMLRVLTLGITPFLIIAMDNVMIIAMNSLLQRYGGENGDLLVTVNTIVQSFMLVMTMPLGGISGGTQCILSYNYGAGYSDRVLKAQRYIFGLCIVYTGILFVLARVAGPLFASLFTADPEINAQACRAIRICTIFAIPLGIQYEIVDGFTGMGQVQMTLPLSFWRKGAYFIALFLIPLFADASMIFYAEPISDILAVSLSIPMYIVMIRKILRKREASVSHYEA